MDGTIGIAQTGGNTDPTITRPSEVEPLGEQFLGSCHPFVMTWLVLRKGLRPSRDTRLYRGEAEVEVLIDFTHRMVEHLGVIEMIKIETGSTEGNPQNLLAICSGPM